MTKYEAIEKDALGVIENYGSDVEERREPRSKAKQQAKRIAEFVRQWDLAKDLLIAHELDLIWIVGH